MRAGRGCLRGVMLPLSMATAALFPSRLPLPRTRSGTRSLPCRSPFYFARKNKIYPDSFRYWYKNNKSQPLSAPLIDARSPSCFAVESSFLTARFQIFKPRPRRSLARGGAYLRARSSPLCIAALPLLPTTTRESQLFVRDAPSTTQLDYYAEALRPHVEARS